MKSFVLANCFAYSRLIFVGHLSYLAIGVYWAMANPALRPVDKAIVTLVMASVTAINCGLILLDGQRARAALQGAEPVA